MLCYKCQRYGHSKDRCKKPAAVCFRCGKGGYVERDCLADPHCVSCRGDHAASSKTCPKFVEEQAILRYKAENGGMFQQACEAVVVEIHKTILTRTFASAFKSQLRTKPVLLLKDGGRRGKKPRRILQLSVPREQQNLRHQPSAGPKGRKDSRSLGKHSIILHLWPWKLRRLYPQSGGGSSIPSYPRASASPMECPLSPSKSRPLSPVEKPQGPLPFPSPSTPSLLKSM
ncbi:nucleic-acid-binding protein from mobile element jockey [Plakobranchus ocellatus]|uniref:Nucleic-acid-binding protein from mobile element jockey n=1 Tax=Plakobranchus ocellatus TaxID=259542 RepID=A0AAV4C4U3_9GAST|nr:nucleic-acid-binding protein from mobile element jockey [Plakobranchus ocellatus]